MAHEGVKLAVEARLGDQFGPVMIDGKARLIPIVYPNAKAAAPKGQPIFIQVQYPVANNLSAFLNRKREEGAIRLIIHEERAFGTTASRAIGTALTARFMDKRFAGVQTFTPSTPVEDDRGDSGAFYTTSITVPYHFYYAGSDSRYD